MHFVFGRVINQRRFKRGREKKQVAPPILHLAQQFHLSWVINDQVVQSPLIGIVAIIHLEMDNLAAFLGLLVQTEDLSDAIMQFFCDLRCPYKIPPVPVSHCESEKFFMAVKVVCEVDGFYLIEDTRGLDTQPYQAGHRIRFLIKRGDLRVILEFDLPKGVLQHLLRTEAH